MLRSRPLPIATLAVLLVAVAGCANRGEQGAPAGTAGGTAGGGTAGGPASVVAGNACPGAWRTAS